jgi:hypothetical protein
VSQIKMSLVDANDTMVDTVTVDFGAQHILLATQADNQFGSVAPGKKKTIAKGHHKTRVVHDKVNEQDVHALAEVVIDGADPITAEDFVIAAKAFRTLP